MCNRRKVTLKSIWILKTFLVKKNRKHVFLTEQFLHQITE